MTLEQDADKSIGIQEAVTLTEHWRTPLFFDENLVNVSILQRHQEALVDVISDAFGRAVSDYYSKSGRYRNVGFLVYLQEVLQRCPQSEPMFGVVFRRNASYFNDYLALQFLYMCAPEGSILKKLAQTVTEDNKRQGRIDRGLPVFDL